MVSIITAKRGLKGVLAIGSLSWLVYYQHLEDTGGNEPFVLANSRIVQSFKTILGQAPVKRTFEVIHSKSEFTHAILKDGTLETALAKYRPSWFYFHPFVGSILSVM